MESGEAAQAAISAMNGAVVDGRAPCVNEAEARPERLFGGGGGPRGGRREPWHLNIGAHVEAPGPSKPRDRGKADSPAKAI
jgi:hypothetical protein